MYKLTLAVLLAMPVLTNRDCGGCDGSSTPDPDPVDPCLTYTGQESDAQMALTPRGDVALEELARELGGGFTADQALYDRVVADVAAAKALEPDIAGITYRSSASGGAIVVGGSAQTLADMQSGAYTAWDCPNAFYELDDATYSGSFARLTFDGIYDAVALADEYENLSGIDWADPDYLMGDGPTICAEIDGDTHHYIFDEAWGDCPAGCIEHHYYYFRSDANGDVTYVGDFHEGVDSTPFWPFFCST